MRSMSYCCMRQVPSASRGRGVNSGTFLAIRKLEDTSVTRSFKTGKAFMGVTVMGSPAGYLVMRVMHKRRGVPLISALHEPQRPALQFQRTARSGVLLA